MTQGKRLVTEEQIISAVDWCLACVPADDVSILGGVLWEFHGDFRSERQEIASILEDLHYPRNRKCSWSLLCGILTREAINRNNPTVFWSAGFEVLKCSSRDLI